MAIPQLKERIINNGIKEIQEADYSEYRKQGGIEGFELARALHTREDFEQNLRERHEHEEKLIEAKTPKEIYWRYRSATLQIEFVYKCLQVVWGGFPRYSGRAYECVTRLLLQEQLKN